MTEDEFILSHILNCSRSELYLHQPRLTDQEQKQYQEYKSRRQAGEPLQYILGSCNFMGLELEVNSSVLIPRPETEQLVDGAFKFFKGGKVLDLGTGSGCMAIAIAKAVSESQVVAMDISPKALEVAGRNALRHGVDRRIDFVEGNMLQVVEILKNSQFDLIVSNPPYISQGQLASLPEDVQKEPRLALDGGIDGLDFYRSLIKNTPLLLRAGACLMMEFGDGQAEALKGIIALQNLFSQVNIIQDLAGRDRIIQLKI